MKDKTEDRWAEPEAGSRGPHWERELLEDLASGSLKEQRRARRWGVFFKLLGFAYLAVLLWVYLGDGLNMDELGKGKEHTALVRITGIIAEGAKANADSIIKGLRKAFKDDDTKAVILSINSPGGSPVQAGLVHDEIKRLRAKYTDIPVYAVAGDLCASGGYYIAVAADSIYADKASLVGSIGVRMDSFGLVEAINKLGIERRLLTAGENKGMLDPFLPVKPQQRNHVQGLLDDIHRQFIAVVREGRGDRLKETDGIFSGLIWTGDQAMDLGLVDGMGGVSSVARDVIGVKKLVDYTEKRDVFERLAERIGTSVGETLSGWGPGGAMLR